MDIGSVFGTYIRIKPYQVHPIEKGHAYLIGAETIFHITEKISKQVKLFRKTQKKINFLIILGSFPKKEYQGTGRKPNDNRKRQGRLLSLLGLREKAKRPDSWFGRVRIGHFGAFCE